MAQFVDSDFGGAFVEQWRRRCRPIRVFPEPIKRYQGDFSPLPRLSKNMGEDRNEQVDIQNGNDLSEIDKFHRFENPQQQSGIVLKAFAVECRFRKFDWAEHRCRKVQVSGDMGGRDLGSDLRHSSDREHPDMRPRIFEFLTHGPSSCSV